MLYTVVLLFAVLLPKSTEQCTEKFMELPFVTYGAQRIGIYPSQDFVGSNTLRVLTEYQFNCSSTNITSLMLGIDVRRATNSRNLYPSVQVFRPNGSLVTGSERTIYYSPSNVSTSGVFEYPLNPPIPVMSGDLLAVSQPEQANSTVTIRYIGGISFRSSQNILIGSSFVILNTLPITDQLILVYPVTDGYCVNSTNSINASFIKEKALEVQRSQPFYRQSQFIYPWIVFSCNGSVTKWIFGANNNGTLSQPELQIWRQLGPNNYNKIGSSLVNANTMIDTNLYEFIPQTPLEFQEGDIFGVYSNVVIGERLVLYERRLNGPNNLRINGSLNSPPSTISETLITVNNDYPLVTVRIDTSTKLPLTSSDENMFSTSTFDISSTTLITPTTQPSATFLVHGIIVAVVCIIVVCTCLLIVACVIVFVKKRSKASDKSNPKEPSTSLKSLSTPTSDSLMNNPLYYSTTTELQDNPAYTSGTILKDNPAYACRNNDTDTHMYDDAQFYDTDKENYQYNEYI